MKFFKYLLLSFFTFMLVIACGGEEKKKEEPKKVKIGVQKEIKKKDDNVANVVLTANDSMQYNKKEIKVKAGQKVRLTLRHIGRMNIDEMGHNFILLKMNVNADEFVAKAATEQANGYIPKDSPDIIAHTKLIGGGEITVIEFDAPEPGVYQFLCSFPAHYATMRGKFIVE
ncbi:MAG: azurin [Bacteroidetes bacterium]|nr:azurin [Bacteroidota bacterium]